MFFKKRLPLIPACALALAMLAGCSSGESAHTHTASGAWEYDATEHWHLCECGEKMDAGKHALTDTLICSDCGIELWELDDGTTDIYSYTESGDPLHMISYDADGNVLHEQKYQYEYDENGNKLTDTVHENGVLTEESEYKLDADGESYLAKWTYYHEDGSINVNEYDEQGNTTAVYFYDAEGALSAATYHEHAVNSNGGWYEAKTTEYYYDPSGAVDSKHIYEYNAYSDLVTRTEYDADDNIVYAERYERDYNDDGDPLWEKTYRNDILVHEIVNYAEGSDDSGWWRYPEVIIEYDDAGNKILVSEYGENMEVAKETHYTPDGEIDRELTYEYEVNEDGSWSHIKAYAGDRLVSDSEYAFGEEGWSYKAKVTEYFEDGSMTVTEYDEYEEILSETQYDADGNKIG